MYCVAQSCEPGILIAVTGSEPSTLLIQFAPLISASAAETYTAERVRIINVRINANVFFI